MEKDPQDEMDEALLDLKADRLAENVFFCFLTLMFYGGLSICAYGIEGVAWYSGTALAAAVHGLLLAYREGCF